VRYVYVAACCSVLECGAACCSVLECGSACCNVLECGAACCSVLEYGAACSSAVQCVPTATYALRARSSVLHADWFPINTHCNTPRLQHTATTLQHAATH